MRNNGMNGAERPHQQSMPMDVKTFSLLPIHQQPQQFLILEPLADFAWGEILKIKPRLPELPTDGLECFIRTRGAEPERGDFG